MASFGDMRVRRRGGSTAAGGGSGGPGASRPGRAFQLSMVDPASVSHSLDAFVSLSSIPLGDGLLHAANPLVDHHQEASLHLAGASSSIVPDRASLSDADETMRTMIKAVEIGAGSEAIQKVLSVLVNTPGIRQILQVIVPPATVVVAGIIEAGLPLYIQILDTVSKTGGHEGLLPDGIDVTMKAVQRLAAQGEIVRAFKVLQAAWPTTTLRASAAAFIAFSFYALAPPGLFFGLFDIYIVSPIDKALETKWKGIDFTIGKKLGGGNFGTVFEAKLTEAGALKTKEGVQKRVVLKRILTDEDELRSNFAKKTLFGTSLVGGTVARGNFETGKVESYFNERVRRYGFSGSFASYLGGFVGGIRMKEEIEAKAGDDPDAPVERKETVTLSAGQWLVWDFQGDKTLEDYLDITFPYNMEVPLFGKSNQGMSKGRRETEVIKNILYSLLAALKDLHRVGIIHRDVKPANLIVAEGSKPVIKCIDLGAAVDLRTGVNFNPETGLLDPKYAPPEQLVVPQEVPRAPPRFVALLGAPALWQLTSPDRFDTYSVGVMLLQLSVPELRPNK